MLALSVVAWLVVFCPVCNELNSPVAALPLSSLCDFTYDDALTLSETFFEELNHDVFCADSLSFKFFFYTSPFFICVNVYMLEYFM